MAELWHGLTGWTGSGLNVCHALWWNSCALVHLAQLDELSELRTRIRSSRELVRKHHELRQQLTLARDEEAGLARQAASCLDELLERHREVNRLRLELADAEKGCSSGEGHLSVLRRIAEKLSSDSLAKNAKDAEVVEVVEEEAETRDGDSQPAASDTPAPAATAPSAPALQPPDAPEMWTQVASEARNSSAALPEKLNASQEASSKPLRDSKREAAEKHGWSDEENDWNRPAKGNDKSSAKDSQDKKGIKESKDENAEGKEKKDAKDGKPEPRDKAKEKEKENAKERDEPQEKMQGKGEEAEETKETSKRKEKTEKKNAKEESQSLPGMMPLTASPGATEQKKSHLPKQKAVEEEPQEVAEVLPAAVKKGSKVQKEPSVKMEAPTAAEEQPQEVAEVLPAAAKKASKVQKEPSVKMEAPAAAEEQPEGEEHEEDEPSPAAAKKGSQGRKDPTAEVEAPEETAEEQPEDVAETFPAAVNEALQDLMADFEEPEVEEEQPEEEEQEEDEEVAEPSPAAAKKGSQGQKESTAELEAPEAAEEEEPQEDEEVAETSPAPVKKDKRGSQKSQEEEPQEDEEVAETSPAPVKKDKRGSQKSQGQKDSTAELEAPEAAEEEEPQEDEEVAETSPAPVKKDKRGSQKSQEPPVDDVAESVQGVEEALMEDEDVEEEPEEEVEIFDCEAGEDVKELGLMPTAFAPDPVEIASVTDGSWAATMGVQQGDILLKINGTLVEAMDKKEMKRAMRERPLRLTISRQTLGTLEESMEDLETFECTAPEGIQDLGLYPSAFPPDAMIITTVTAGSWAAQQGIEVGDELIEIGQRQVQDMAAKETKRAMRDRPLHLVFQRVLQETPSSPAAPATPAAPAPSASASVPASSTAKQRKSRKPPADAPDQLTQAVTQAANEARKSLAAILPEGLNPLAQEAKGKSPRGSQQEAAEEDGWDDDDDDDWGKPSKPNDKKSAKESKDKKSAKESKDKKAEGKDKKDAKDGKAKQSEKTKEKEKEKTEKTKEKDKPKEKAKEKETKDPKEKAEKEKVKEEPPPLTAFAGAMDTRLGFKVDWPPNPCYVTKVEGGSWAEMSQVEVGLRLDKAGGKDVAKMSKEKLKKLLDETRPLQLAFVKDKKKKKPPKPEQNDGVFGMFG